MDTSSIQIKKFTTPYIGSHLEPFSFIREGFQRLAGTDSSSSQAVGSSLPFEECNKTDTLRECIDKITSKKPENEIHNDSNRLHHLTHDATNNIFTYRELKHNVGSVNNNILFPQPTLQDGRIEDNQELATKETALYVVGGVTILTLFISAIMLAKD
jgi:hypothetical protein